MRWTKSGPLEQTEGACTNHDLRWFIFQSFTPRFSGEQVRCPT